MRTFVHLVALIAPPIALAFIACVSDDNTPTGVGTSSKDAGAVGPSDAAAIDAGSLCDPNAPFGAANVLEGLPWQPGAKISNATLTADEKTIYFIGSSFGTDGGLADTDIFTATRTDRTAAFGNVKRVESLSQHPALERHVSVTGDGQSIFFTRQEAIGTQIRLYFASANGSGFGNIGMLSFPDAGVIGSRPFMDDYTPSVRSDGTLLYFGSIGRASASADIFKVTVPYSGVAPTALAELNVADAQDYQPVLSADELDIYFASNRGIQASGMDVWHASRKNTADNFSTPEQVASLSSEFLDFPTWLSPDGCNMYLTRNLEPNALTDAMGYRIYVARKSPK